MARNGLPSWRWLRSHYSLVMTRARLGESHYSLVMARARPGELTARRHAFLRISVKAPVHFLPKLLHMWACFRESDVIWARRVQHLQLAEDTAEQQECHQPSAPAGSVSWFSSSVYWHSYVEAALLQLQLAHFFATLAWVSNKRYFVNYSNTPETICRNASLLRISHTLEWDLEMVHIFRTGPLRWSTSKISICKPVTKEDRTCNQFQDQ